MKNRILKTSIALLLVAVSFSSCYVSREGRPRHHRAHEEVIIQGRVN